MTLVSALMGSEGVVFFCDTQETQGGYAKKTIDKMTVWDFDDSPFRFAISGATDDATYLDMLERMLTGNVLRLTTFDLSTIEKTLADTLTDFYAQHIWPQGPKAPLMEFLMVFQPLPSGHPEVFHVAGTAVNVPSLSVSHRSIGIGAYMADYLFSLLAPNARTQKELTIAAAYVGNQVKENVDGCGPIERVVLLGNNGEYAELGPEEIQESLKIMQPIANVFPACFIAASSNDVTGYDKSMEYIAAELEDIRQSNKKWWNSIQIKIKEIAQHRKKYNPKKKSS